MSVANAYELKASRIESSINSCYPKVLNAVIQQELNSAKAKKSEAPFDTRLDTDSLQRQGSTYNTTYQKLPWKNVSLALRFQLMLDMIFLAVILHNMILLKLHQLWDVNLSD